MPNPLFENQPRPGDQGIFGLLKNKSPEQIQLIFNQMYKNNPEFRDFANSMKGKTPEQAFKEHGFDFNSFKNMA